MILDEFIDKVFNRYKCTAPDISDKKEEIISVLIGYCEKVDFQKLLDVIAKEHDSDFVPSAAKIRELSKNCYKTEYKKTAQKWLNVKVYNPILKAVTNTECFPAGTSEETMLNSYKKMFPKYEGWKIIEVY